MSDDKFLNKYRIATARAPWHGYDGGAYFVTICTQQRKHYFGEIRNGQMNLSSIGQIADNCWRAIPQHFPHVEIPLWVIMPNHIHGIILIHDLIVTQPVTVETQPVTVETQPVTVETQPVTVETQPVTVETQNFASLQQQQQQQQCDTANKFGPQSKNLASVIRGFKIGVTKFAHANHIPFAWQTRFHDHIIRNQDEMNRIALYIEQNVAKWNENKLL